MVLEKLHILMSLFVGLIFTIAALYAGTPLASFVPLLLATMVIFYLVGLAARAFIRRAFPPPAQAPPAEAAETAEAAPEQPE